MSGLVEIHSNWVSAKLTPLEEICLSSFVVAGHKVFLHCYKDVKVPDGVTVLDANRVLPEEKVFRHKKSGSLAMFADLFRYRMLQEYAGVCWVDADIFCLKPFDFASDYIFGEEKLRHGTYSISNAVMKLPPDDPVLRDLVELFDNPIKAARFCRLPQKRLRFWLKGALGNLELREMDRSVAGPPALTHFAQKHDVAKHALPVATFFESQGTDLFDTKFDFQRMLQEDVYAAHFLGSQLPETDLADPPAGSFYEHCVSKLRRQLET